jgi:hypothetical protein
VEIQWENGLGGSGGSKRIFSVVRVLGIREKIKKIRFNPPDPPNPFSHCIGIPKKWINFAAHSPKIKIL